MNNSKVTVTGDEAGNVVIASVNNPEYGYIRVQQKRLVIDDQNFAKPKIVSALVQGLISVLSDLKWKVGTELEGNVIFKEQLTPFNKKAPERDFKIAGKTGIICVIDGAPIYRKSFYNVNDKSQDVFITDLDGNKVLHTNGEDIKVAYAELKAKEELEAQTKAPKAGSM